MMFKVRIYDLQLQEQIMKLRLTKHELAELMPDLLTKFDESEYRIVIERWN